VVIVYDDLTIHADVHRSLALVLGRPVGREAHPVDVFYAHARLLERATQFGAARGGGSITAFPIVETQAADLSAYVPTNIVSITDGQIRLDADLLAAGLAPAVDVGLSVSRVGGKAQPPLCRKLAGSFKNRYAQFLELESFARFGTRLEPSAQSVVDWGRRVRVLLGQPRGASRSWPETIARLLLANLPQLSAEPLEGLSQRVEQWCQRMVTDSRFASVTAEAKASDPETLAELEALANRVHKAESKS
jgi:F-type H+-transporting ATPase subunit alpha